MPRCGGCGASSPEGARYCLSCGTRLGEEGGAARRTVTVLFSDISGFTGLAEHLDAESLPRMMSRFYDEMRMVVEKFGGTVARFIGDAVMAVFGIPQMHEDDAVRAVHAALEMHEKVALLSVEFQRQWGVQIQVCTGLNTGEVATDNVSLGDALVVGDTVNVAARLQQAAAPGEVLLGASTSRLVRDLVLLEELEPLALKGRGATVTASRVLGLQTGQGRQSRRQRDSFVGREAELEELRRAFRDVVDERTCRLALVVGPAGMGKSHLVSEFVDRLEGQATVLYGFCQPFGEQSPLAPVAEVVRQAAGLRVEEGVDAWRARLLELMEGVDDRATAVAHVLAALGFSRAASGPDEIAWAVRKLFEALALKGPLVLVVEDLHWGEPTLLGLVQHVRDWTRDVPILLVGLTRPDLFENDVWKDEPSRSFTIELTPLATEHSAQLLETMLHGAPVAEKTLKRIAEVGQGNPLYLEEVLSMLVDDGVLRQVNGRWVLTRDTTAITAPLPIQVLLATRLDRLSNERRVILQTASVIGNAFSLEALRVLLPPAIAARVEEELRWLGDNDFLADRSGGDGELQFHHVLLREAAYNCMTKETRARLHEELANWLKASPPIGAGMDEDALIGHHLERAYRYAADLRPIDEHVANLARTAGEHLSAAGCRLFESGDMPVAASVLSRAVSLLPPDDSLSLSLLPNLAEALLSTGELGRACEVADQALARAQDSHEQALEARAVLVRSTGRLFTDPEGGAEALDDVRRVLPVLEAEGEESGLAKGWYLLSMVEIAQSRFAAAEDAMERAAAHAHRSGDRRQELDILAWLPLPVWIGPRSVTETLRRYEEVLDRAGGDPKVEAMVTLMTGAQQAMLGRFDEARGSVTTARAILEDLGLRFLIAGTSQVGGWVNLLAGDFVKAELELSAGYSALEEMGETGLLSTLAGWWAQALFCLGSHDEAERTAKLAESLAGENDFFSLVLARSVGGRLLAERGRLAEAEQTGREAVELAGRTDSPQLIGDACMDLSATLVTAGKVAEAAEQMQCAKRQFEKKGNLVALARVQETYDSLELNHQTGR